MQGKHKKVCRHHAAVETSFNRLQAHEGPGGNEAAGRLASSQVCAAVFAATSEVNLRNSAKHSPYNWLKRFKNVPSPPEQQHELLTVRNAPQRMPGEHYRFASSAHVPLCWLWRPSIHMFCVRITSVDGPWRLCDCMYTTASQLCSSRNAVDPSATRRLVAMRLLHGPK
eukprot:180999-Pleurochrysis_carterae.AAC.3